MRVQLKEHARPVIVKARRYPGEQREWLDKMMGLLVEYGIVNPNPNATWAAAPLIVKKNGPAKYRLTFDYRPINAVTVQKAWSTLHIEAELMDLASSKFFAILDLCQGYWQMPLHPDSQNLHSFITPKGIFKPTRTTQGIMNGGSNFSSRVEPCFQALRDKYDVDPFKAWLDDILTHSSTMSELLEKLELFFQCCERYDLKLSASKCQFFLTEVHWCGRIIESKGVRFDPSRLSGLQKILLPRTAGELCEYVYCLQWMSTAIPGFAERIAPLRAILENAYTQVGSRKKKAIQSIPLTNLAWGTIHENAFHDLQSQISQATTLVHRKSDWEICVFTDASEVLWAGVITQRPRSELEKEHLEQKNEPLAFLSAAFNDTERGWSTFEKEGYAILKLLGKLDYMFLVENDTHVFTDHRNLLFVYNPEALEPALGRRVIMKVQRWALYLSRFAYTIEHIAGEENVMADIMNRWYSGYRGQPKSIKRISNLILERDMIRSPLDKDRLAK